jgi:5-methylthioadenosine/S-adenosylhomocysteine deaminase
MHRACDRGRILSPHSTQIESDTALDTLIKNARVLTMDEALTEYSRADILIRGTKIVAIAPDIDPGSGNSPVREVDASNKLVMPGLINGHFHSPLKLLKGAVDGYPLEIGMLYQVPPFDRGEPSARISYIDAMLSSMEMLHLGVTSVHDDAYYNPIPTPGAIDGTMSAYRDAGIRATVTINNPNVVEYEKYPFLEDILPDDVKRRMEQAPRLGTEALLSCYDHLITGWHKTHEGRLRAGLSVSAPQRVTGEYFQALSELGRRADLPLDVHMLETKVQQVLQVEKFGGSIIKHVDELGLLNDRTIVIHAVWADQEDLDIMARSGCMVALNPIGNLKIGSGVGQLRRLLDAGIPVCFGSDGNLADETTNMWIIAKTATLVCRIDDPDYSRWPTPVDVLRALFQGGARAMARPAEIDQIKLGYEADLIMLDTNSVRYTPLNNIYRQLVFAETGSSVVLTMVAGEIVMENGKLTKVNERAILDEARRLAVDFQEKLRDMASGSQVLKPYYDRMYFKSVAQGDRVGRWLEGRATLRSD